MRRTHNPLRAGCRLTLVLLATLYGFSLTFVNLPTRAASGSSLHKVGIRQRGELESENLDLDIESQEPPEWWYDPNKAQVSPVSENLQEPPEWWYVPQNASEPSALDFTTMDIAVSLQDSQNLNAGAISLNVKITADGETPELIVQVTSDNVPNRAVYAGYEKHPDGAIQNLGGFQQAQFLGGVSPDNTAEVTFIYEALTDGWLSFTVQVWSEGNRIFGPQDHVIYISPVSPTFTNMNPVVTVDSSRGLNAGGVPLSIEVTADGQTPELIVQVTSEDVPERAVYVGYAKHPEGAVQNSAGFQQARFLGGVGPDNTAEVTFKYEALTVGWLNFTVQVWSEGNLIYGPQEHSVYVNQVIPTFTSLDITTIPEWSSRGLNAGAIPLSVEVTADGQTPELIVQVTSEDVPERAVYAGYEKHPEGAVQNLGSFQQARFLGGVGPDNTAEIAFKYEALTVGWLHFTVQVWSEGNLLYEPEDHWIYVRETGIWTNTYPPVINDFSVASQEREQVTFNVEILGNPNPQYELVCDRDGGGATIEGLTCLYHVPGKYFATLTASNFVDGVEYSEVVTAVVLVFDHFAYFPLVMRDYSISPPSQR
jgi:hypothetical protein